MMETSQYYNLNLPSRDGNDVADINEVSENFRVIDRILGEEIPQNYVDNPKFDAHLAEKQDLFASVGVDGDDIDLILNRATAFKLNGITRVRISENETMIANGVLSGDMDAVGNRIKEIAPPQSLTDATNKQYVDESIDAAVPKWKTLSAGTLSEGGVASIKAALTEDVSNIREMNFYLFFKATEEMNGKTAYLNANINGTTIKNCFYSTQSDSIKSGYNHYSVSSIKIIKSHNGYMVQGIHSKMSYNFGTNSRGNATGTMCDWEIAEGATQNLTINISSTTFPVGTKWVLEGR